MGASAVERRDATTPTEHGRGAHQVSPYASWIPPGTAATIGDLCVPGGMLYVGQWLPAADGSRVEPALVDPELALDWCTGDGGAGEDLPYWPAYDTIGPASRAAYLRWLAGGRRAPGAPIGHVFLFFYGLERRLLYDIGADPSLGPEIPALRAEVLRLLGLYGSHASLRRYASDFLNLLDLLGSPGRVDPDAIAVPELRTHRWPPPMALRRALGEFAAGARPVPPRWALTWAWHLPDIRLRTAAVRCRDEFERLFVLRYAQACGDGLRIDPGRRHLRVEYQPASSSLRTATYVRRDIPDVFLAGPPARRLGALVTAVTDELGSYSRWLRRHRDRHDTVAAAAMLPRALLVDPRHRATRLPVVRLQRWLDGHLPAIGREPVDIDAGELIRLWSGSGTLARWESAALAGLLAHLGVGLEPDVRLGGPPLAPGRGAVIFRSAEATEVPGPAYPAALAFADLLAAVTAGNPPAGPVAGDPASAVAGDPASAVAGDPASAVASAAPGDRDADAGPLDQACAALSLTGSDRARLHAHLRWLRSVGPAVGGPRRLDALPAHRRAVVGDLLVARVAGGGRVEPAQVAGLIACFRRLGLDPDSVAGLLHASLAAGSPGRRRSWPEPATGPVTVQRRGDRTGDYALPSPPVENPAEHAPDLDGAAIRARLAETAEVSALLDRLLADEETDNLPRPAAGDTPSGHTGSDHTGSGRADRLVEPHAPAPSGPAPSGPAPGGPAPGGDLVAGLDAAHSALLRELAERPIWPYDDFQDLAARSGLLPAAALDVLNEAALEAVDEPLTRGETDLEIDPDVLQELLA